MLDRTSEDIIEAVEREVLRVASEVLAGRGFHFDVPSRARSNQQYVPELDRIVLKDSIKQRHFGRLSTNFKTVVTLRVMEHVMSLCRKQINVTKRDLFYTDVKLFQARQSACLLSRGLQGARLMA